MRARVIACVAGVTTVLIGVSVAIGAPGSLREVEEQISASLSNAQDVTVAPNGRQVYGVGYASNEIGVFNRNATTGAITFADATSGDGLNAPNSVVISPDGDNAYVAGNGDSAIHAYERNATTGFLNHIDSHLDDTDGVTALGGTYDSVVVGDNLYVTGSINDGVVKFNLDGDGEMSFSDEYINGLESIANMDEPRGITVSPDGRNVYVASHGDRALVTFRRFPSTGQLTFLESDTFDAPAEDVGVSPDGTRVYAAVDNGVVTLRRNASNGRTTSLGLTTDPPLGALGLGVSPDGRNVYSVFNLITDGVTTLAARRSGKLRAVETDLISEFVDPAAVTVSRDGRHIYLAGGSAGDGHIAVYSRQPVVDLTGRKNQGSEKLKVKVDCSADCKVKVKARGYRTVRKNLKATGRPKRVVLKAKGDGTEKATVKASAKAGNRRDSDKLRIK